MQKIRSNLCNINYEILKNRLFPVFFNSIRSNRSYEDIDEITGKSKSSDLSLTNDVKIEMVENTLPHLAQSLYWNSDNESLYYIGCDKKAVRYDYAARKSFFCDLKRFVGKPSFIMPLAGSQNTIAVGIGKNVELLDWNGVDSEFMENRTLLEVEDDEQFECNRFNVGKCDALGRLFVGTMRDNKDSMSYRFGSIYKCIGDSSSDCILVGVGIPNGFCWSKENDKFYFVDTAIYKVIESEYDFISGIPSGPKPVYDLCETLEGQKLESPLDMTIDTDNCIFLTAYNRGTIYKINTRNWKILHELRLPCKFISSICFGGPNMDMLFVSVSTDGNTNIGHIIKIVGLGSKGALATKLSLKSQ